MKVPRDQLENIFGKETEGRWQGQRQAIVMKASQQQLKALSWHASSNMEVINGEPKIRPIKIARESPPYSNAFGKFFEANPEKFKQLQDMDVFVSLKQVINNKPNDNRAYTCVYIHTLFFFQLFL